MKKLIKIFILLLVFPIVMNAEESEVTMYRFYKEYEKDVYFDVNPEDSCKYPCIIDRNTFIYTDYAYSVINPESKEGREVEVLDEVVSLKDNYINRLRLNNFNMSSSMQVKELQILDSLGNKIPYHVVSYDGIGTRENLEDDNLSTSTGINSSSRIEYQFDKGYSLSDIQIKVIYSEGSNILYGIDMEGFINTILINDINSYYTNTIKTCEDGICTSTISIRSDDIHSARVNIAQVIYKYRDKMFKCYTLERVYVPGYFKTLRGFTKDSEKTQVVVTNTVEVEKEVVKEVEVPVEVFKEIEKEVPVEVTREVEVVKEIEVPVEVIKEVEKIVEVPKEVEKIVEVPKEVIKEVPTEVIRYVNSVNSDTGNKVAFYKNEEEKVEKKEEDNQGLIAMNTQSEVKEEESNNYGIFLSLFGVISLIVSLIIFKKIVKIRGTN